MKRIRRAISQHFQNTPQKRNLKDYGVWAKLKSSEAEHILLIGRGQFNRKVWQVMQGKKTFSPKGTMLTLVPVPWASIYSTSSGLTPLSLYKDLTNCSCASPDGNVTPRNKIAINSTLLSGASCSHFSILSFALGCQIPPQNPNWTKDLFSMSLVPNSQALCKKSRGTRN